MGRVDSRPSAVPYHPICPAKFSSSSLTGLFALCGEGPAWSDTSGTCGRANSFGYSRSMKEHSTSKSHGRIFVYPCSGGVDKFCRDQALRVGRMCANPFPSVSSALHPSPFTLHPSSVPLRETKGMGHPLACLRASSPPYLFTFVPPCLYPHQFTIPSRPAIFPPWPFGCSRDGA
jgi:hypothetical protein